MFAANTSLEQDGELQFSLDVEAPAHDRDPHATALSSKKKQQASSAMAHMMRNGGGYARSRSPSRASSRGASRFGGTALPRGSALAVKLTKLSLQPRPREDTLHAIPWDERSDTYSQTSHKKTNKLSGALAASLLDVYHWPGTPDNGSIGSLTASTSRTAFDFKEAQRREEIASDLDARERRQRIAREVRRKGDLKPKLRSIADPMVSLEKAEALALAAVCKQTGSRGIPRPQTREDTKRPTPASAVGSRKAVSPVATQRSHHLPQLQTPAPKRSIAIVDFAIPEDATFRKEDYDELQSEVVVLDPSGEVLVGENCFLVVKKSRSDLLLDLLQKNSIEPRVTLPPLLR